MDFPAPGRFRTIDEFAAHLHGLDPTIACAREPSGRDGPLGRSFEVWGRTVGNRFAVHPMEGWDGTRDGLPTEHTLRRWRRFGASGAGLVWGGEAVAVRNEGRANPHQLCLDPASVARGAVDGLRALLAKVREGRARPGPGATDLLVGLQLTHSGRFARPDDTGPRPRIAFRHPVLDPRIGDDAAQAASLLSDRELEAIADDFVRAAGLVHGAGFDFVDVKCCHGYLLHEVLAARGREGPYGGSFENRTRLFRRIVDGIRAECPGLPIAVRVSITDVHPFAPDPATGRGVPAGLDAHLPYRHGFGVDPTDPLQPDLDEPLRFLALLQALDIPLVNITLGSPYYCPHLQRPAAYPPSDGYQPPEDPLRGVIHHLRMTRACKAAFPGLAIVGSGYSYLQEWLPHVAEAEVAAGHVDAVGLGRMILSYPDLPRDVLAGRSLDRKRICRTFSDCTTAPRNGLISGCYPLDPHYRALPQAVELKVAKKRPRRAPTERPDHEARGATP